MAKAQVLYDFDGATNDELSLRADEYLTITNQDVGGGWWEATNQHGQAGLIPKDYVEIVDDALPEPSMPPPPLPSVAPVQTAPYSHSQADSGWGPTAVSNGTYGQHVIEDTSPSGAQGEDDWDDGWSDESGTTEQTNGEEPTTLKGNIRRNTTKQKTVSSKVAAITSLFQELSNYNKLGFDATLLSQEALHVPDHEKVRIVECRDGLNGWQWEPPSNENSFTCLVDSPKKSSKLKGLKSFIVYQLTPSFSGIAVQRRYKHFDWLHERLSEKYPTIVIPPLPDKQISGRYEEDFINERMKMLQEWVTRLCNHPVVCKTAVWKHFLSCTDKDEKGWKRGKRDAENDKYKGGKFFLTLITPPAPLNNEKVSQDIESFAMFVKKMDEGVKHMSNVASNHIKKYPNQIRKLYSNVADSVGTLHTAFNNDGCHDSEPLNHALSETGRAYSDIATMCQQQVRQDWGPLHENLHIYRGILGGFEGTLGAQRVANAKIREATRLQGEGKLQETELSAIASHADAISYSLYAEISHFHRNRRNEFKIFMANFLTEQIEFYKKITSRLEEAKRHYDSV